jgi:hypothetical protein
VPLSELGEKLALTPAGRLLALSDTLPVSPPTKPIEIEAVPLVAAGTLIAVGEAEIVKFGSAVTFRVKVVLEVIAPLDPVIVTVAAPTVAVFDATKVRVEPAEPVTVTGLKVAVTPAGRPVAVKATAPAKPLIAETVMLVAAVDPCNTLTPVPEMLNPGAVVAGIGGKAFCTSVWNSAIQKVPAGGEGGTANSVVFQVERCVRNRSTDVQLSAGQRASAQWASDVVTPMMGPRGTPSSSRPRLRAYRLDTFPSR